MKLYYYTKEDHGWEPESGLRFDSDEIRTRDPEEADLFIVPTTIRAIRFRKNDDPRRLKYIERWPEKHVLWDICDNYDVYHGLERTMFIRCVVDQRMLDVHPRTRCQPWPTDNLADIAVDYDNIKHVVSFIGWDSGPVRGVPATALKKYFGDKAEIGLKTQFFAYYPEDTQKLFRQQFLDSLRSSMFILAPPSIYYPGRRPTGFVPYRFYEAMSAGRIPVHVGERPILPFMDKIKWDGSFVCIPPSDAETAGAYLHAWSMGKDTVAIGKSNRRIWEQWLNRDDWPRHHRTMVEEMMRDPD